jgi:hypothetical protein
MPRRHDITTLSTASATARRGPEQRADVMKNVGRAHRRLIEAILSNDR